MAGRSVLWIPLLAAGLPVTQLPGAEPRDWALEMPNWPDLNGLFYADVSQGENTVILHILRWQPGWDRDNTRPQATAVKLTYRLENDRVRVEAFVVLGPFDQMDTPRSLEGVPQESAGILQLRLGESATLDALAKYGLEPLPVRLVINKPPVPAVPQIINNTSAIRVEGVDQDRTWYKLSLRNLSSKNITGVVLTMASNGGGSSLSHLGTPKQPIIPTGGLHQFMVFWEPSDGSASPPIIIAVATFEDGSFEGSEEMAAGMEAQLLGAAVEESRINALLRSILDHGESDDSAMISAIRSRASALSEEAEPTLIDTIMAAHARLPSTARASIGSSILMGMHSGKESLRHSLTDFERNPRPPGMSLRAWLEMQSAASKDH